MTKGLGGGGVAGGIDWGISYLPTGAVLQATALGGAGLLLSTAAYAWLDRDFGSGIAGGTGALLLGRVRNALAVREMAERAEGNGGQLNDAGAVGRVSRSRLWAAQDAAAVTSVPSQLVRPQQANMPVPQSLRAVQSEAGYTRYAAGDAVRRTGPDSWITQFHAAEEAGTVFKVVRR